MGVDGVGCWYVGWCFVVFWVGCVCGYEYLVGVGIGDVCYLVGWVYVVFVLCGDCYVVGWYCCCCELWFVVCLVGVFVVGDFVVGDVFFVVDCCGWYCFVFVCGYYGFVEYFWCGGDVGIWL